MPGSELVQSLIKGLKIIQIVGDSENGMRLNDIIEKSGMKSSTAHNLIKTLLFCSFLEKKEGNLLCLGRVFLELAYVNVHRNYKEKIAEILKSLVIKKPASMAGYSEISLSTIALKYKVEHELPDFIQEPVSMPLHPYGSSAGIVCLAFGDKEACKKIIASHPFEEYGAFYWKSMNEFENFLKKVRIDKYAISPVNTDTDFRIAVPIFKSNRFIGSLGLYIKDLSFYKSFNEKEIIKEIRSLGTSCFNQD